jgi:hypothetical protein
MKYFLVPFLVIFLTGCSWFGPSDEEKKAASSACEKFVSKRMGVGCTRTFDVYKKKGKLVAEVGYAKGFGDCDTITKYSVRLCVIDNEKGTITLPAVFNEGEWSK